MSGLIPLRQGPACDDRSGGRGVSGAGTCGGMGCTAAQATAQDTRLPAGWSGAVSCGPMQWLKSDRGAGSDCAIAIPLAMARDVRDRVKAINHALTHRHNFGRPLRSRGLVFMASALARLARTPVQSLRVGATMAVDTVTRSSVDMSDIGADLAGRRSVAGGARASMEHG